MKQITRFSSLLIIGALAAAGCGEGSSDMKRRLQTWGLALVLGLALSAAFDVGHPRADKQALVVAGLLR